MGADDDDVTASKFDVVVPRKPTDDGKGMHVVRLRDAETECLVELAEVRPVVDGKPIPDTVEMIKLSPRTDLPAFDVEVVVPRRELSGPPQVATERYMRNWESTFNSDAPDDDAN